MKEKKVDKQSEANMKIEKIKINKINKGEKKEEAEDKEDLRVFICAYL